MSTTTVIIIIAILSAIIGFSWALIERAKKRKLERDSIEATLDRTQEFFFCYENLYRLHLEYKGAGGNPKELFEKKKVLQKLKSQILQTVNLEILCTIFRGSNPGEGSFSMFARTMHEELIADKEVQEKILVLAKAEQQAVRAYSKNGDKVKEFLVRVREPFFYCENFDLVGLLILQ